MFSTGTLEKQCSGAEKGDVSKLPLNISTSGLIFPVRLREY